MTDERGGDAACWADREEDFEPAPANLAVVDDPQRQQLVMDVAGALCTLDYRREGDEFIVTHVFVPTYLRGRSLGGQLVDAAVAIARDEGRTVVPVCSYAAAWLRRRPKVTQSS